MTNNKIAILILAFILIVLVIAFQPQLADTWNRMVNDLKEL